MLTTCLACGLHRQLTRRCRTQTSVGIDSITPAGCICGQRLADVLQSAQNPSGTPVQSRGGGDCLVGDDSTGIQVAVDQWHQKPHERIEQCACGERWPCKAKDAWLAGAKAMQAALDELDQLRSGHDA